MNARPTKQIKSRRSALSFLCFCLIVAGFEIGLLVMGTIREQPSFWHDVGGFPVWVREFVLFSFYPLLALALFWLFWISRAATRVRFHRPHQQWIPACLAGLWLLQGMVFVAIVANNFDNFRHHRPLHWHPPTARASG